MSLKQFLNRDFQNFWDIRRCGKNIGLLIKCPACIWKPPKQQAGEHFIWYGYRKWRALANHMATDHLRELGLRNRRIEADNRRMTRH